MTVDTALLQLQLVWMERTNAEKKTQYESLTEVAIDPCLYSIVLEICVIISHTHTQKTTTTRTTTHKKQATHLWYIILYCAL